MNWQPHGKCEPFRAEVNLRQHPLGLYPFVRELPRLHKNGAGWQAEPFHEVCGAGQSQTRAFRIKQYDVTDYPRDRHGTTTVKAALPLESVARQGVIGRAIPPCELLCPRWVCDG